MDYKEIPIGEITRGNNPRTDFDPAALEALATSIATQGLLQPIVVWADETKRKYVVIAGERRFRAMELLTTRGKWAGQVPCMVQTTSRETVGQTLQEALVENLQREDLGYMDEARSYAQLRDQGLSIREISDLSPKGKRHVELRLNLVDKLTPKVQKACDSKAVELWFARELASLCPLKRQNGVLKEFLEGNINYTNRENLRQSLLTDSVPASKAAFDKSEYKGDVVETTDAVDPNWPEDEDAPELEAQQNFFTDVEQFRQLQRKAADTKVAELEAEGYQVTFTENWQPWNYEQSTADPRQAIVAIENDEVKVFLDMVKRATEKQLRAAASAAATPAGKGSGITLDQLRPTVGAFRESCHLKTDALRESMVVGNICWSLAAVIVGLWARTSFETVSLSMQEQQAVHDATHETPAVARVYKDHWAKIGKLCSTGHPPLLTERKNMAAQAFRILVELPELELMQLFQATVANAVGVWAGIEKTPGDDSLAIAMAEVMGSDPTGVFLDKKGWYHSDRLPDFLEGIKAGGLLAIALESQLVQDLEPGTAPEGITTRHEFEKLKTPAKRELLVEGLRKLVEHGKPYLPVPCRFGSEKDLEKALKATLPPAAKKWTAKKPAAKKAATKKGATKKPAAKKGAAKKAPAKPRTVAAPATASIPHLQGKE